MANSSSNWQEAINPQLLVRLVLPLSQGGMIKRGISQKIIDRSDRFLNRLPLLSQQMQRWGSLNHFSSATVPIVYAQNISRGTENRHEVNQLNQLVSPQTTSSNSGSNLANISVSNLSSTMPLQAKFSNSQGLAADTSPSSDRPSIDMHSDVTENSQESLGEITLQAKFANSESAASAPSLPLVSPRSSSLLNDQSNQSISDYPVVVPKLRDSGVVQESLILPDNSKVFPESLPIAQPKLIDSVPSWERPIVNYRRTANYLEQSKSPIFASPSSMINNPRSEAIATNSITTNSLPLPEIPIVSPQSGSAVNITNFFPKNIVNVNQNHEQNRDLPKPEPLPIVSPSPATNPLKALQNYPLVQTFAGNTANQSSSSPVISDQGSREIKVFASPSPPTETIVSSMPNQPRNDPHTISKIDVEAIASQVERKLMRRLVVESERRGGQKR